MIKQRYISGQFNPFEINKILLDSRTGFEKLVPADFYHYSYPKFVVWSMLNLVKAFIDCIIKYKWRYMFSNVLSCRDWFDNTLLFYLPTYNNQKALDRVINIVVPQKKNVRILASSIWEIDQFPRLRVIAFSFLYLPFIWKEYRKCSDYDKRLVSYYRGHFILTTGFTWFFFSILSQYRPECIVLSNDHHYQTKCVELVCEEIGIKTIYVQHASVSFAFPELHYSYSFLDGMDAFIKYTHGDKKPTGDVFLLGAARYDELSNYRTNRTHYKRNCFGIAINKLDSNIIVNDCCNKLLAHYPEIILKIRSHPGLKNTPFHFDNKDRIIYTNATDESMADYLDSIDLQIGGDSGVHFDAIIGGVRTMAYNFTHNHYDDNYGYVKDGILQYAENIEKLYKLIDQSEEIDISKIRFFDESYEKSYSGKCSGIIAGFILHEYDINYMMTCVGFEKVAGKNMYYIIPK